MWFFGEIKFIFSVPEKVLRKMKQMSVFYFITFYFIIDIK